MTHRAYVYGENPSPALERLTSRLRTSWVIGGHWAQWLCRYYRFLRLPPHVIVLRDGSLIHQEVVGVDGIEAMLAALDPSEPITIVAFHQ